MKNEVLRKQL